MWIVMLEDRSGNSKGADLANSKLYLKRCGRVQPNRKKGDLGKMEAGYSLGNFVGEIESDGDAQELYPLVFGVILISF